MTAAREHEAASATSTHKTRGFMRAIGGMFHRKSGHDADSRASLHNAPPAAPVTATATSTTTTAPAPAATTAAAPAPQQQSSPPQHTTNATLRATALDDAAITSSQSRSRSTNLSSSNHNNNSHQSQPVTASGHSQSAAASSQSSGKSKMKAAARHVVRNPFRKKSSVSIESKESVETAPSDDDDDADGPTYACQFLFYPGSAEDNSFKPDKVHSSVPEIDYNAIRPSLTLHMPVFFSPPTEHTALRRSSILTDPREYEL